MSLREEILGKTDAELKGMRRLSKARIRRLQETHDIIEAETIRRSIELAPGFPLGMKVEWVINGHKRQGVVVEKTQIGAVVEVDGLKRPQYLQYLYLKEATEDVSSPAVPGPPSTKQE